MSFPPWDQTTLPGDPDEIVNPNDALALEDTAVAQPDIATDEQVIAEDTFNQMADRIPGWTASDGNLDVYLIEVFSRVASELRTLIANVPDAIFVTYGTEVLGIGIDLPASAIGVSTWTAEDDRGYRIEVGTQFTLARTGDELVVFEVVSEAEIVPGEVAVSGVEVRAVEDGIAGNGLSGYGEVVDPLIWVKTIFVQAPTHSGADGQTQAQYLELLIALLRVVALRPILPGDFAILALRHPNVGRAVAMDGFDPSDGTWGHARTATLVVTQADGEPVADQTLVEVKAMLESLREINFVVNVIRASYQTVDVTFEVTAFAEQDTDLVHAACIWQLETALSPAAYRLGATTPAITGGEVIPPPATGQQPGRRFIRQNDLIGLLDRTRGVDWVMDVTITGGTPDLEMNSSTTLPRAGQIQGIVHEQPQ